MGGCDISIFIRILFHNVLIAVLDQAHNRIIRSICLSHQFSRITIDDVSLSKYKFSSRHQLLLNHILDILDLHGLPSRILDAGDDTIHIVLRYFFIGLYFCIRLPDCHQNFIAVIVHDTPVSLDNLHLIIPCLSNSTRDYLNIEH